MRNYCLLVLINLANIIQYSIKIFYFYVHTVIFFLQDPSESLGISVSGGVNSPQGDTPIYVTNIKPTGCLGRTKQIKVRSRLLIFIVSDVNFFVKFLKSISLPLCT